MSGYFNPGIASTSFTPMSTKPTPKAKKTKDTPAPLCVPGELVAATRLTCIRYCTDTNPANAFNADLDPIEIVVQGRTLHYYDCGLLLLWLKYLCAIGFWSSKVTVLKSSKSKEAVTQRSHVVSCYQTPTRENILVEAAGDLQEANNLAFAAEAISVFLLRSGVVTHGLDPLYQPIECQRHVMDHTAVTLPVNICNPKRLSKLGFVQVSPGRDQERWRRFLAAETSRYEYMMSTVSGVSKMSSSIINKMTESDSELFNQLQISTFLSQNMSTNHARPEDISAYVKVRSTGSTVNPVLAMQQKQVSEARAIARATPKLTKVGKYKQMIEEYCTLTAHKLDLKKEMAEDTFASRESQIRNAQMEIQNGVGTLCVHMPAFDRPMVIPFEAIATIATNAAAAAVPISSASRHGLGVAPSQPSNPRQQSLATASSGSGLAPRPTPNHPTILKGAAYDMKKSISSTSVPVTDQSSIFPSFSGLSIKGSTVPSASSATPTPSAPPANVSGVPSVSAPSVSKPATQTKSTFVPPAYGLGGVDKTSFTSQTVPTQTATTTQSTTNTQPTTRTQSTTGAQSNIGDTSNIDANEFVALEDEDYDGAYIEEDDIDASD
jgi:hypothetical protein